MNDKRPSRPTHPTFTEDLWTLVQRCWDQDPYSRPQILEVSKVLTLLLLRKRLINPAISTDERIRLIATISSDDDQVKVVGPASGDDAQTLIDVIDEVSPYTISYLK